MDKIEYEKMVDSPTTGWIYNFSKETFDYIKDNVIIYDEIYRQKKSLHYSLNKETLILMYETMKKWNKSFILILEDGESNWYYFKNQEKIHELCAQTGIPEDKIVYITNDVICNKLYDNWFKDNLKYRTKINFISHPSILMQNLFEVKSSRISSGYYDIEKYQDRKILPTKKFICLMGKPTKQRDFLWEFFENNTLLKNSGYISYLGKKVSLPNSSTMKGFGNFKSDVSDEWMLEYQASPGTDRLREYYKDCYFSVVSENEGGAGVSEKIGKAMLNGHPFILLSYNHDIGKSSSGMLSKLKEWGFETFPELFDESYDEISNVEDRRNNFKQQILRLCNMETSELQKLCESVEDKCIHNQKILLSLEIPNKQLVNKLESLKNG
jgi:hypothetical protein